MTKITHLRDISSERFLIDYKPIPNSLNPFAAYDFGNGGTLYAFEGEDLEFVGQQDPCRIWTVVYGPEGDHVLSGIHLINRMGYIVTERSFAANEQITVDLV